MPSMPCVSRFVLLGIAALACTTVESVPERPWIEVETPNFRIASTLPPEEAIELANDLELFRTVAQTVTNLPTVDSVIPTRIFVFEHGSDFELFTAGRRLAGYFMERMRANYLVMRKTREIDESRVIRHEYVHFLMNNATQILYPLWYSEGFAEFLSTVTLHEDGRHAIIGAFPVDRQRAFDYGIPASYERIISMRPGTPFRGTMFYEQSWALVHWLQLGRGREHLASQEMGRYLELVNAGYSDADAFEQAFGIDIEDVRKEIDYYLRGHYKAVAVPLSAFDYQRVEPRVNAMPPDAIAVALGELMLARDAEKPARGLFDKALVANASNARAHAGLGRALALREDWEGAEPHLHRALALDPEDAENELDYGICLHSKALADGMEEQRAALLKQARQHYVRSYRLDPGIPETYAMYGSSFLAPGEDPTRGLETLEHAYSLLPSNTEILWLLARAYVKLGREDDARPLAERIVATTHAGDRAEAVDEMLAELAETDEDEGRDESD
jgi:tetratricopeptide (TPR) repeat protein